MTGFGRTYHARRVLRSAHTMGPLDLIAHEKLYNLMVERCAMREKIMRRINIFHNYFGIIALCVLVLAACGPAKTLPPTVTPIPPTLEAVMPIATSIRFQPAPRQQPTFPFNRYMSMPFAPLSDRTRRPGFRLAHRLNIIWGWNAKTEAQINDFLDNNNTIVTLDGKVIEGTQTGGIMKVEARNDLEVLWVSEVGILDPGQHTIIYDQKITKKIEDGYNSYGPGTENETIHDECLISVE